MVVRAEQHGPRWQPIRGVHARADMRFRKRQAVVVETKTEIDSETGRDLHLVLHEPAGLPASLAAAEDDRARHAGPEIRPPEVDVALVDGGQVREVDPRLTQVIQVLSRAQQREVDSALDRMPTVQTCQVAFDTESIQRSVGLRLSAIWVDALRKLINA